MASMMSDSSRSGCHASMCGGYETGQIGGRTTSQTDDCIERVNFVSQTLPDVGHVDGLAGFGVGNHDVTLRIRPGATRCARRN